MKPRLPSPALWILILLALLASSCGMPNRVRSMFGGQLPIPVSIAADANEDSPLAVELIVVYNDKLIDKLLEKKARDWFAGREQFLRGQAARAQVAGIGGIAERMRQWFSANF